MKIIKFQITILLLTVLFSCSKDNSNPTIDETRQTTCETDINLYPGTACCLEGPLTAVPGQIISVSYFTNIENPHYEWEVVGNSITLVEGEHAATATFRIGSKFVLDSIVGLSYNDETINCSDVIVITSGNN